MRVPSRFTAVLILFLISLLSLSLSIPAASQSLVVSVEEKSAGPFAGESLRGCLLIYADGRIVVSHRSHSQIETISPAENKESAADHVETKESRFKEAYEISELKRLLSSRKVLNLASYFKPPHSAIDYFETTSVTIPRSDGRVKTISASEYYVASLDEKVRYPSGLIVLLDRLAEVEREVVQSGKEIDSHTDCPQTK